MIREFEQIPGVWLTPGCERHIPEMAAMEQACFSDPWPESALRMSLGEDFICLVLEARDGDRTLIGYGMLRCVLDEGQLYNIAVAPAWRGRGLGLCLLQALVREGAQRQLESITLEVRSGNAPAISLYRQCQFQILGRMPQYYESPREDGLVMTLFAADFPNCLAVRHRVVRLDAQQLQTAYERVYVSAFPPEELKPLSTMLQGMACGAYETLALMENGAFLSYASLWRCGRLCLLDYLCTPEPLRGRGYGASLLTQVAHRLRDEEFLLIEAEAPDGDEMRARRVHFYERWGAVRLSYECLVFQTHYITLGWARGELPAVDTIRQAHDALYRTSLPKAMHEKYVHIPLPAQAPEAPDRAQMLSEVQDVQLEYFAAYKK